MTPAEMRQCVVDIVGWFEAKAQTDTVGASEDEIKAFSRRHDITLPLALEELYLKTQGGLLWFEEKKMTSLQEAAKLRDEIKDNNKKKENDNNNNNNGDDKENNKYYPFANDDEEDLLVVDCDTEAVFEYDLYSGLGTKLSESFTDFIETYRNLLLADHFDYFDDIGLVEKVGIQPNYGK
ncbi:hypothetical protein CTAYLR_008604 [Chrysophaeum taylorii]|uniref:Knr4/Smi1-like domain-containing protein n=1 Tax=Chrysophaeum taylorii TaxID=2483200 RepID=A0AAD7XKV3_9STRA|nr:hypothetical protein CTAYLR_008604 [Chrysophaeum taylorii]